MVSIIETIIDLDNCCLKQQENFMKKAIAIALIVFGLVAIIGGVIMLFGLKGDDTASVAYPHTVLPMT